LYKLIFFFNFFWKFTKSPSQGIVGAQKVKNCLLEKESCLIGQKKVKMYELVLMIYV